MPKKRTKTSRRKIEPYAHRGKTRANNPPAGLVTPKTDPDKGAAKKWAHDPHIDPHLQWAGKAEGISFEVRTVSLHVHERIDPRSIIQAVRRRNGNGGDRQDSLFDAPEENPPLREAIEFYKHSHNWSNRLIAGDSLLVMNSLLQKENMGGKVQCVYIDPPYGIKYGSNFQPFVNKRDVKDGKDEDLTAEPEMIKAFRDTWELGIHSYLSYMRDRLLLAKELLAESGSIFVQISDENVHHVRELMSEVFKEENFVNQIGFRTAMTKPTNLLNNVFDYILWYAKNKQAMKYRPLFVEREFGNPDEVVGTQQLEAAAPQAKYSFEYNNKKYNPMNGWRVSENGMKKLAEANRLHAAGSLRFIRYAKDFPYVQTDNMWSSQMSEQSKDYVVQTSNKVIQPCMLMTTDPGDIVFDPTCGSGTAAYVAEQWGRRWITCDTSRVATALARQRLMTATFDYYELADPEEGVGSGFHYKTVPHITLKSIANQEPPATETLYDQPHKDRGRARVTGPFTVEAVPSPAVRPPDDIPDPDPPPADASIARSGETLRQSEWRDELLAAGIRAKRGQHISFSRIAPLPCRWLHAEAETKPDDRGADGVKESATAYAPKRAVISFGPKDAPLEQKQVELALQEAGTLKPAPKIIIFAAFQFDPEAAKDIDETDWPGVTLLKAQMNADLETSDLKKKRASNESFWLIGQPDVTLRQIRKGGDTGKWLVEVRGFDYFNTRTGDLESGGEGQIAVWMLDTDYDGRSLYPSQVFFPMADAKTGWSRLARNLRAEVDEDMIEAYHGTASLPFEMGEYERVAVKIVDDRGVESLRVLPLYK
ncbi:MAG: site-specific DNA-methyltransferase [Gammaproteobacteria bacterium]|nr:site-specific DNA-methyltransferase [Gammaproteobacteria bacterium]MDA7961079.1 site-specific DNA-methyltransferase [Gammaproteobacteria bacterium]MDA8023200.1 site-specific DNA-methyltransferase [Gammaproteobacteria bacterium]